MAAWDGSAARRLLRIGVITAALSRQLNDGGLVNVQDEKIS
jgi:hypothetical protein